MFSMFSVKDKCLTIGGADPNRTCIFPFVFEGIKYSTCIKIISYDINPWCSTMVDETGMHVSGQDKWGDCGPKCPMP